MCACQVQTSFGIKYMTPTSLIIVADRGSLKGYRVTDTPTRGPSLNLVQAFNITDAHGRMTDKVTDMAGRFPVADANSGRHMNAVAERTQLETETRRRIYRELADQISKLVKSDGIEGWSFAAPAEFHSAIVDLLPTDVRNRIVEHVKADLVKVEPAKLAGHFRSLQPI
jgi:protein required for attachment to host cells